MLARAHKRDRGGGGGWRVVCLNDRTGNIPAAVLKLLHVGAEEGVVEGEGVCRQDGVVGEGVFLQRLVEEGV